MRIFLPIIAILALIVVGSSAFVVKQTELAILLKFGEIVKTDYKPGLHWRIPVVHEVRKYDGRIQTLGSRPARVITKEQKDLEVDSYVKFRITDPGLFRRSTGGNLNKVGQLVFEIVNSGLRDEFGKRTVQEAVTGERLDIMRELTQVADRQASGLGVEIVDVRVKRINLPSNVSDSVYRRMRTQREEVASQLRSEGNEQRERIQAEADRESTVIRADAYREAQQIRGEGDAGAANIYADAHRKDSEFYALHRSLEAYRGVFANNRDMMVLDPSSDFFRYFDSRKPISE